MGRRAWYRRHPWSSAAALLLVTVLGAFVVLQLAMGDRVAASVSVANVDLEGQSVAVAAETLDRELWPRISVVQLQVADGEEPLTLTLTQLGVSLDAAATAAAAASQGRHHLPLLGLRVWLPGGGEAVAPVLKIDATEFEQGLAAVCEVVDQPARDARLTIRKGAVTVVPGRDGRAVDAAALSRLITASAATGSSYSGPVPQTAVPPRISTAAAEAKAGAAAAYLERPITLRHASRTVVLKPRALAGLLSVNTRTDADTYPLTFRNDRARAKLRKLLAWAERPPVDAKIIVHSKGGITVKESKDGEALDMDFLLEDLDTAAVGGGLRTVMISTSPALPKLSSEDVRSMGLSSLGAQFTTHFEPSNKARAGNIALAAKLVDGSVVGSGETFSLNEAMGPRTVNRGFDFAPVIAADGVLRQGVGGGICQYATTLFNAVLVAGLPVVDRRPHSLYISHYPVGRDATVAWGAIDFKFRNDTPHSLLIRSWVEGGSLRVAIVGRTGRKVGFTTSEFYDIRKPEHGRSDPRVIHDADLGPGVVRWERGVDGRSVKVRRTVRRADGKVLFRDSYVSRYEPLDWVKRVGTS